MSKSIEEYTQFVFDNISKAKLSNSLNIAEEIKNTYCFTDFINCMKKVCQNNVRQFPEKSINFIKTIDKYQKMAESDFNYNIEMITDIFVMELCKVSRGNR